MLQSLCTLEDVRKDVPGLEAGCMHEVDKEVAGTVSSVGVVVASRPGRTCTKNFGAGLAQR
jgi:hypothetical protein